MIAAVEYSHRHLTVVVGVDDIVEVVDGQLAGNLAIVAVEGVITDASVAAQLLVVGGRRRDRQFARPVGCPHPRPGAENMREGLLALAVGAGPKAGERTNDFSAEPKTTRLMTLRLRAVFGRRGRERRCARTDLARTGRPCTPQLFR